MYSIRNFPLGLGYKIENRGCLISRDNGGWNEDFLYIYLKESNVMQERCCICKDSKVSLRDTKRQQDLGRWDLLFLHLPSLIKKCHEDLGRRSSFLLPTRSFGEKLACLSWSQSWRDGTRPNAPASSGWDFCFHVRLSVQQLSHSNAETSLPPMLTTIASMRVRHPTVTDC